MRTSDKNAIFECAHLLFKGDIEDISRSEFSFSFSGLPNREDIEDIEEGRLVFLSMVSKTEGTLRTLLEITNFKVFVSFPEGTSRTSNKNAIFECVSFGEVCFLFNGLQN